MKCKNEDLILLINNDNAVGSECKEEIKVLFDSIDGMVDTMKQSIDSLVYEM